MRSLLLAGLIGLLLAPPPVYGQKIWLTRSEIERLPTSGVTWTAVKRAADTSIGSPNLKDQDSNHDVYTLAKALVYVRTGQNSYREQVRVACLSAIGTERGGRTLALGRNLPCYVIAADLIQLNDSRFNAWLRTCLSETLDGRTLRSTHEDRPNNWGTMAGAARAAIAAYLNDRNELDNTWQVCLGYLGNRNSWDEFKYGDLWWQANPSKPVPINHQGATLNGALVDGIPPDDMRRGGRFQWPPEPTNYIREGLQGLLVQCEILHRAGYPAYERQYYAVLRYVKAIDRLQRFDSEWSLNLGDDRWMMPLINYRYAEEDYRGSVAAPVGHGKIMGWTDWTHPQP